MEDQDISGETTECKCRTAAGLHPLHIPHNNPDVHPAYSSSVLLLFIATLNLNKMLTLLTSKAVRTDGHFVG